MVISTTNLPGSLKLDMVFTTPQTRILLDPDFDLITHAGFFLRGNEGLNVSDVNIRNSLGPVKGCEGSHLQPEGQLPVTGWILFKDLETNTLLLKDVHYASG